MDKAIYEFADRWAAYFQKHHGVNLLKVLIYTRLATWFFFTAFIVTDTYWMREHPISAWFFVILNSMAAFYNLHEAVKQFERLGDYPEVQIKCDILNALALWERERMEWFRKAWAVAIIILIPLMVYKIRFCDAMWVIFAIVGSAHHYLECAFYLGPGEHSKEKNKKMVGDAVPENHGA